MLDMTTKLTTSQLVVNLEKVTSPAMIAITARLTVGQLGYVDLWISGEKSLTRTQYEKLSFAWETLRTMVNINGVVKTRQWYHTLCVPVSRGGKDHTLSPAKAIAIKEYAAVTQSIGPLS